MPGYLLIARARPGVVYGDINPSTAGGSLKLPGRSGSRQRWSGVTDRLWEIEDIARLVENAEPEPGKHGPYKKRIA